MIQVPEGAVVGEKPSRRLFFPVESADAVADCLVAMQPKTETIKGSFEDLWDAKLEWPKEYPEELFWGLVLGPLGLAVLVALILLLLRSWQGRSGQWRSAF